LDQQLRYLALFVRGRRPHPDPQMIAAIPVPQKEHAAREPFLQRAGNGSDHLVQRGVVEDVQADPWCHDRNHLCGSISMRTSHTLGSADVGAGKATPKITNDGPLWHSLSKAPTRDRLPISKYIGLWVSSKVHSSRMGPGHRTKHWPGISLRRNQIASRHR